MRDDLPLYTRHHVRPFGVNPASAESHAGYAERLRLNFPLLSDPEGEVCRKYGVIQNKETEGVRRECLVRSTFVIDKKGVIRHVAYDVRPRGHAAEVFDVVKRLRA